MKKQKRTEVAFEETGFYFDDCPICRGMKEGKANTAEDFIKLLDEANSQQSEDRKSSE